MPAAQATTRAAPPPAPMDAGVRPKRQKRPNPARRAPRGGALAPGPPPQRPPPATGASTWPPRRAPPRVPRSRAAGGPLPPWEPAPRRRPGPVLQAFVDSAVSGDFNVKNHVRVPSTSGPCDAGARARPGAAAAGPARSSHQGVDALLRMLGLLPPEVPLVQPHIVPGIPQIIR